jgi:hypothetical protein
MRLSPRDIVSFLPIFLLLIFGPRSRAQSLLPESPVSASLSNAVTGLPGATLFALNPSQSRADSIHAFRAGLSYSPFVGGLKDANQSAVEGIYYSEFISTSIGAGATALSYGDLYSDLSVYASLAKSFALSNGRKANLGLRFRYETLGTTPNYPKLHFLLADLGFTLDLTNEFSLGGAALNLLGAKYTVVGGETEKLDRRFLVGLAYHPLAIPVKLLTSIEQEISQPLAIGFGAEYDPVPFLALRLGASTDTGNITTGIGILYSNFSFDAGSRFDKALGSIFSFGASGAW